jgi:hypothetical protein
MYVHVCAYSHIYVYAYTHVCIYECYVHGCMNGIVHVDKYARMVVSMSVCVCACTYACVCPRVRVGMCV